MTDRRSLGVRGEALAKKYLSAQGYEFLAANERVGRLELDLIFRRAAKMIFVEVKTRRLSGDDDPDAALSQAQIHKLKRAAHIYAIKNRVSSDAVRLDLIHILFNPNTQRASLRHYKNIF